MWLMEQAKSLIEVLSRGVEVAAALIIAVAAIELLPLYWYSGLRSWYFREKFVPVRNKYEECIYCPAPVEHSVHGGGYLGIGTRFVVAATSARTVARFANDHVVQ